MARDAILEWEGREYDHNPKDSDWYWALGIILYELFTGETPYNGETEEEVLEQIGHRRFALDAIALADGVATFGHDEQHVLGNLAGKVFLGNGLGDLVDLSLLTGDGYRIDPFNEPLVSLADAQTYLGMHTDADAPTVRAVVNAATGVVERYCNRTWRRQTVTGEAHAGGKPAFTLRKHPASTITAVTENGAALAASDYTYDSVTGLLWREGGSWAAGPAAVTVSYVAGEADVPDEVAPLLVIQTANWELPDKAPKAEQEAAAKAITEHLAELAAASGVAPEPVAEPIQTDENKES